MFNYIYLSLSGPKGCGKDTIYNLLAEKYNVIRISNGRRIKEAAAVICNIGISQQDDNSFRKSATKGTCGVAVRTVQTRVADFGRSGINNYIWDDHGATIVEMLQRGPEMKYLIADMLATEHVLSLFLDLRANLYNGLSTNYSEAEHFKNISNLSYQLSAYQTIATHYLSKLNKPFILVKTDDRFPEQFMRTKNSGGKILMIERKQEDVTRPENNSEDFFHIGYDNASGVITNNLLPEDALKSVESFISRQLKIPLDSLLKSDMLFFK